MSEYKITESGVYQYENNLYIPNSTHNRGWREYQKWLAEGNTPDPLKTDTELWEERQKEKKVEVREKYNADSLAPVEVNGLLYEGGMNSSLAIDGATRIAERLGLPTVAITDVNNVAKTYPIVDAFDIAAQVGLAYSIAFMTKQTALVAIDAETQP